MHGVNWVEVTAGASASASAVAGGLLAEGAVVSREVLAQVFDKKPLPFQTNPDGSVDMAVYLAWLEEAGRLALQAFDECFEIEDGVSGSAAVRLA